MNQPDLSADLRSALSKNRGFVQGASYVLMSVYLFRDMMGVATDEALQQSLDAIEEGLRNVESGDTHDMEAVFADLDQQYGVHG